MDLILFLLLPLLFVIMAKNALHWQTHLSEKREKNKRERERFMTFLWHIDEMEGIYAYLRCVCAACFLLSLFYFLSCLKYIILHSSAHPQNMTWYELERQKWQIREWGKPIKVNRKKERIIIKFSCQCAINIINFGWEQPQIMWFYTVWGEIKLENFMS
jgi:hypothetical protein